jgi:hypothetical protein
MVSVQTSIARRVGFNSLTDKKGEMHVKIKIAAGVDAELSRWWARYSSLFAERTLVHDKG